MARLAGAVGASVLLVATAASNGVLLKAAPLPLPVFPILTIVFITSGSVIVAYVAARAYLAEGLPSTLFVGAGSLVFGSTSLLAALTAGSSGSNAATTIFILGALASSALHLACAVSRLSSWGGRRGSTSTALLAVVLSLGLVAGVALGAARGAFPPFFNAGTGATLLAKAVLGLSIGTLVLAWSVISLSSRSAVLYWYSWALAVTAIGLAGLLLSGWAFLALVFWVGRTSLCAGGVFLVLSVAAADRGRDDAPQPR